MSHRQRVIYGSAAIAVALMFASNVNAGFPRVPNGGPKPPEADEAKWDVMETFDLNATIAEAEPNDTPTTANAVACGDIIRPASLVNSDIDFYSFTATVGQLLTVGTDTDGGLDVDTYIYLVDNTGTVALAQDDDNGPGLYSLITNFPAPYTGVYYLAVEGFATDDVGDYRAFVSCATPPPPSDCGITDYKGDVQVFTPPITIPDNNLAGILVGTINTPADASTFLDVVVKLRVAHTFIGDLTATLTYDMDCNGTPDASARFICRPGRAACDNTLGSPFGCSSNLSCNNSLYFSDAGTIVFGLSPTGCGTTSTVMPASCYQGGTNAQPLSVFDHFEKGGCFKLFMADHGGGDVGTVCEWGVYTLNQAIVPVERTTWSEIKVRSE